MELKHGDGVTIVGQMQAWLINSGKIKCTEGFFLHSWESLLENIAVELIDESFFIAKPLWHHGFKASKMEP